MMNQMDAEIIEEDKIGETKVKYLQKDKILLERPTDTEAKTIPEFFEEFSKKNYNRRAMGWRELIDIHSETKILKKIVDGKETELEKKWEFFEYSEYKFITYQKLLQDVKTYSIGLNKLKYFKKNQNYLHIFASTASKWLQTFIAATFQSIPIVTSYDTLGEQGLLYSLQQSNSVGIFTNNFLLCQLIVPLKSAKSVKFVIHDEKIDPNDRRKNGELYKKFLYAKNEILKYRNDIKIYCYDEIFELGKKHNIDDENMYCLPQKSDIACIMYTSGSTGDPKGVVLKHENLIAGIGGISVSVGRDLVRSDDIIIAFLPLAHIFELIIELTTFWWGCCLGYANSKTLSDGSLRNCKSDMVELKPTIMVGVAAVWENIRKSIITKINKESLLKRKLFWYAFKSKEFLQSKKINIDPIFDILFQKIKKSTGGNIRYLLNGGSSISRETQTFINVILAPILIGYGLTETCANGAILDWKNYKYNVVGSLTGAVKAKLIDDPELGYFVKNLQGEICFKGKCVFENYYRNEAETKSSFTKDGWFKTGDIGEWTKTDELRVIDRKKNLIKTLNGEYISLEKLESVYRSSLYVSNVCIYANEMRVKPIAIIVPNEKLVIELVIENKWDKEVDINNLKSVYENQNVIRFIFDSMISTALSLNLKGIDLIESVILTDYIWSIENDMLTSALKLKRRNIINHYKSEIDAIYNST